MGSAQVPHSSTCNGHVKASRPLSKCRAAFAVPLTCALCASLGPRHVAAMRQVRGAGHVDGKGELTRLIREQPEDRSAEEIVRELAFHGGCWPKTGKEERRAGAVPLTAIERVSQVRGHRGERS
jgi:hypothetical protein